MIEKMLVVVPRVGDPVVLAVKGKYIQGHIDDKGFVLNDFMPNASIKHPKAPGFYVWVGRPSAPGSHDMWAGKFLMANKQTIVEDFKLWIL